MGTQSNGTASVGGASSLWAELATTTARNATTIKEYTAGSSDVGTTESWDDFYSTELPPVVPRGWDSDLSDYTVWFCLFGALTEGLCTFALIKRARTVLHGFKFLVYVGFGFLASGLALIILSFTVVEGVAEFICMFFGLIHLMWFVFVLKMGCLGFGKNSGPNFQQQRSDGAQASNDSSSQTLDELAPDYPPSYSVTVTRRGLEPQLGNPGSSDIIISANPFGGLSTAVPVDPRWDDPPAYSEIQLTEEEGKLPKV